MRLTVGLPVAALLAACLGCSASPPPQGSAPPANLPTDHESSFVSGAQGDTVGAFPGSPNAMYQYRFKQIDPSSDYFSFKDRYLSFYFRPSPTALYFQVENLTDRPAFLEWDRCQYLDAFGSPRGIANGETRWEQRYATLPPTQISGLQRYSAFVFPMDYLIDPGGSREQLHRPLFPEDQTAVQYVDREFGVVLVFRTDQGRTPYTFRFKVKSVVPR